jgi:predicted DNA binding CopG/RHH family protein
MSATIPIGADVGLSISGRPGTDDFGGDNCFEMHCFWIGVVQVPEDIAAAANEFEIAPLSVMQHLLLPNKIGLKLHTSREIMSAKKKQIPRFATDEEAERFVDTADLAEYDLTGGVPMDKCLLRFEQYSKDANINLRLPEAMLKALRDGASKKKIPTQRYIRIMLEKGLMAERAAGGPVAKSRRKAAVKPASTRRNVA